jgi:hypothetical protein
MLTHKEDNNEEYEIDACEKLDKTDLSILEYGKSTLTISMDVLKNFAQSMITIVSGLFITYFALLKFLEIDKLTYPSNWFGINLIIIPPLLFILSLISFIFTIMPLRSNINMDNLTIIKTEREKVLLIKYIGIIFGLIFFLSSMVLISYIFIYL